MSLTTFISVILSLPKFLSDKNLSWNKNEGIQFVTKAFDKTVKAAFLGVGYGVTFARNKIMMSKYRTNFHNNDNQSGPLNQRIQEEKRIKEEKNDLQITMKFFEKARLQFSAFANANMIECMEEKDVENYLYQRPLKH